MVFMHDDDKDIVCLIIITCIVYVSWLIEGPSHDSSVYRRTGTGPFFYEGHLLFAVPVQLSFFSRCMIPVDPHSTFSLIFLGRQQHNFDHGEPVR